MAGKPKPNSFQSNSSLLAGILSRGFGPEVKYWGDPCTHFLCVLGWVRGFCSPDLRLLGLSHFLACSSEIAFNLHKLWGIFLLFLQFLLLKFKLNRIQKQENNYLQTERLSKNTVPLSKVPNDFISQRKEVSPGLHLK